MLQNIYSVGSECIFDYVSNNISLLAQHEMVLSVFYPLVGTAAGIKNTQCQHWILPFLAWLLAASASTHIHV